MPALPFPDERAFLRQVRKVTCTPRSDALRLRHAARFQITVSELAPVNRSGLVVLYQEIPIWGGGDRYQRIPFRYESPS
jgi:hypothetical protein